MNTLLTKTTSALSGVVLFAAGCILAGLGFAVVAALALFALCAVGVAVVASPFVPLAQPVSDDPVDANAPA